MHTLRPGDLVCQAVSGFQFTDPSSLREFENWVKRSRVVLNLSIRSLPKLACASHEVGIKRLRRIAECLDKVGNAFFRRVGVERFFGLKDLEIVCKLVGVMLDQVIAERP